MADGSTRIFAASGKTAPGFWRRGCCAYPGSFDRRISPAGDLKGTLPPEHSPCANPGRVCAWFSYLQKGAGIPCRSAMKLTYVCPAPRQTLREILRNDLKLTYHQTQETARNGRIRIDGKPFFFNQVPREGQLLEIDLPAFAPWKVSDESLSLPSPEVLYRDDALLAVNKPHNLVVHQPPHQQHFEDTLQLRIHAHLSPRYHALHRLDAETGGIVLFTRYPYVTSVFHRYLEEHLVHKVYDALTEGWIPEDAMTIDLPIERLEPDSFTRVVREDGKPSRTEVRVLERLCIAGRRITRVQLSPVTGRTHQLRVHLSHIGFPILGDPRYASVQSSETSQLLRISFLQLFAREMTLPHPQSGQPLILRAPSDIGSDITDD